MVSQVQNLLLCHGFVQSLHNTNYRDFGLFYAHLAGHQWPITLISGRNNTGKTTLLEGIFLAAAYKTPDLFLRLNAIRGGFSLAPSIQGLVLDACLWENLFSDMDMTLRLEVAVEGQNNNIFKVSFEKDDSSSLSQFTLPQNTQPGAVQVPPGFLQPLPGSYLLKMSYSDGNISGEGNYSITQGGLSFRMPSGWAANNPAATIYDGPNTPITNHPLAEWFGNLELLNKKQMLIDALKLLDKGITDIFSVPKSGAIELYARWEDQKPRPLRTLGDGLNKLLSYLLAIITNPGGVFLLDEIETGFHYSFYPHLWELLAAVVQETGSQVIATTHSYECIKSAVEGVGKIDESILTYVRLGKEGGIIVPHLFPSNELGFALVNEMEVR